MIPSWKLARGGGRKVIRFEDPLQNSQLTSINVYLSGCLRISIFPRRSELKTLGGMPFRGCWSIVIDVDEKLIPKDSCGRAPADYQKNPLFRVVSACDGCREAFRSRGQASVKNLVLSAGSDGCQHSNFRKSKEVPC
ncbi:MAG: hypothetical protein JOZ00_08950 [Mycobacterium sp.]|uniref:hypothetical protein n=1 Tax=Mycobacterium sp. TaxID=1785 RepID=UPI001EC302CE|nr:hypothetical protein [Mycobacterium sp.]MBV8786801.1 hypothetical protein [Mycobacterium sp.]